MYLWPNCSSDTSYDPDMIEMYAEIYAQEVQWNLGYPVLQIFRGRHGHFILMNAHHLWSSNKLLYSYGYSAVNPL